jgi:hypothetical protein
MKLSKRIDKQLDKIEDNIEDAIERWRIERKRFFKKLGFVFCLVAALLVVSSFI